MNKHLFQWVQIGELGGPNMTILNIFIIVKYQ